MDKYKKRKFIKNDDILIEPNDILKSISQEVKIPLSKDDSHILRLLYNHVSNSQDEEYATKYQIRSAVGIAAIQIGVTKRMIAIKTSDEQGTKHKYMLVNPTIIAKSDQICCLANGEGCLSVEEGLHNGVVPRHHEVSISAYNLFTHQQEIINVSGYLAIVFQHELDHLDGILYIDHINKVDPMYINDDWIKI